MRILVLVSNLSQTGGIQNYNKQFVKTLSENKENVLVCEMSNTSFLSKAFFVVRYILSAVFWRPDVTFCSHINFSFLCLFTKKLLRIRYSVSVYGIEMEKPSFFAEKGLSGADLVVYLFESTRMAVNRKIEGIKFFLLPNSVDIDKFPISGKNPELVGKFHAEGKKIIYTLCRLSASERDNKGYEKVIRALPKVLKKIPNAKYVLAGGGDDINYVKNLINELGLNSKVELAGRISDDEMADFYNLADVFVFPSKKEGFPAIVILEALACGKPIVGGNQPGSEEFKDSLGSIIDPDNNDELAEAIVKILNGSARPDFYDAEFLRKKIDERYGLKNYRKRVDDYLRIFRK